MKRTSATGQIASSQPFERRGRRFRKQTLMLSGAFVCFGLAMFLLGRNTAPQYIQIQHDLHALQMEIHRQQGKVDRLNLDHEQSVNALAARLAELQAASTRLDALGERLAQMGQLSLDEFDFGDRAALGGPAEYQSMSSAGEEELKLSISALSVKLRRQSSQLSALQFLIVNRQLQSDFTPAGWPVSRGWISSRFGERNDPFTGERAHHRGLDFAGTRGTEVLSVASGVVIWAANRAAYGKTIEIDHGNGYRTRYAHNEKLAVSAGDRVIAGEVIAKMGSTGRASAPHVHFEVLKDGERINPSQFVSHIR